MHNKSEITDKDDVFTCHECVTKKTILNAKTGIELMASQTPIRTL